MHVNLNKGLKNNIIYGLLLLFLVVTASNCGNGKKEISEVRSSMLVRVDSLWGYLNQVRGRFIFKLDEFEKRRSLMEKEIIRSNFIDGSQLNEEQKMAFIEYERIHRLYKALGPKYKNSVLQGENSYYSIKGLETQVKKGFYDKNVSKFLLEYNSIKSDLLLCRKTTFDVTDRLKGMETLFMRVDKDILAILDELVPEKD